MPFSQETLLFRPCGSFSRAWALLEGKDAKDFLHRVSTVDLRILNPGSGSPGCLLTAQGKIRSYFWLWCLDEGKYGFELEPGKEGQWLKSLARTIEELTFAEKMSFSLKSTHTPLWIFNESGHFTSSSQIESFDPGIQCHWLEGWSPPAATLWSDSPESFLLPSELKTSAFIDDPALPELWRIQSLIPSVDMELAFSENPLELGLASAIANAKGCYPGQEVIERTIAIGEPARRLALLQGEGPSPATGSRLFSQVEPRAEAGVLSSSVSDPNNKSTWFALGLLKKNHAHVGGELCLESDSSTRIQIRKLSHYEKTLS